MIKIELSSERKTELYNEAVVIANDFKETYLEGHEFPIKNTFTVLERLNFIVLRFPSKEKISGFHLRKGNYECIFINTVDVLGRQYFSAWHEVYHAVQRDESDVSLRLKAESLEYLENEYKAECFASSILMPREEILNYVEEKLHDLSSATINDLIHMQHYFNVSLGALLTTLRRHFPKHKDLIAEYYDICSKEKATEFQKLTSSLGLSTDLILPTNDLKVPESFFEHITNNFNNGKITEEKVSKIFELFERVAN